MICQFKRLIYPKAVTAGDASYMIALYRPCEKVMDAAGNVVSEIKAVGYCLPTADNLRYDMRGRWSRSAKHGIQFEVEGFDEVIVPSKEGVIAYLCSGQIKGIGPKTAEKIYAMFGQNTLTVLDHEPEQLLAVSGISKTKLKKICDSYLASRGARDVVAFLAPHGVTPNRAVKLYKQYGEHTMDIVRNHPYRLCEMVGIGFKTADRIAVSMGFDPLSPERVDEGLIFTLTDAELKGHLCMEKHSFLKQCLKLLDTEGLTEEMLAVRASRMLESGRLASYDRQVYRAVTARTEQSLAWAVYRMLTYEKAGSHVNIDMSELTNYNAAIYVRLSKEDEDASDGRKNESNSITNQKQLILDYLQDKPEINIVSVRIDDGYTGTNYDRPAFQLMMNDIKAGTVNCVVVKDLSRFGREYINAGKYIDRLFPFYGVRLIAINDNIDTVTRDYADDFSITLKNLMNDNYCRDISMKIRSQFQVRRKNGEYLGAFAPYGYMKSEDDHTKLEIDPYAAGVIQDIFRWKIEGMSQAAIAKRLTEQRVLAPLEYKRSMGSRLKCSFQKHAKVEWTAVGVGRILSNRVYTGTMIPMHRQSLHP